MQLKLGHVRGRCKNKISGMVTADSRSQERLSALTSMGYIRHIPHPIQGLSNKISLQVRAAVDTILGIQPFFLAVIW